MSLYVGILVLFVEFNIHSEGALIWYINQTVMARVSRATFGTEVGIPYNEQMVGHCLRASRVYIAPE